MLPPIFSEGSSRKLTVSQRRSKKSVSRLINLKVFARFSISNCISDRSSQDESTRCMDRCVTGKMSVTVPGSESKAVFRTRCIVAMRSEEYNAGKTPRSLTSKSCRALFNVYIIGIEWPILLSGSLDDSKRVEERKLVEKTCSSGRQLMIRAISKS